LTFNIYKITSTKANDKSPTVTVHMHILIFFSAGTHTCKRTPQQDQQWFARSIWEKPKHCMQIVRENLSTPWQAVSLCYTWNI